MHRQSSWIRTVSYTHLDVYKRQGYYSTHFPLHHPPMVREATAHFEREGKHYLITSGTTGYYPNPSQAAVAETWHGPYEVLGNPHPSDKTYTSFHSQISSVFKMPGKKNLYIALADRWMPEAMDLDYNIYGPVVSKVFDPKLSQQDKICLLYTSCNLYWEKLV